MGRKRDNIPEAPKPNAHWSYSLEIQVNGRNVTAGTELKISGERGRFRFVHHVSTGEAEWVDVWGGPKGSESMRSFRMDRIKRVHYKNTTDQALVQEYKAKKIAMKSEKEETSEDQN